MPYLFNFYKSTHDYVSLITWAQQAATIYSIYISTAARSWNVFLYLKNISTTAFLAFLRQHSNSQMQSAISLSLFLSMRFYTCWLNDCHFLRITCARCWPPPVRRLTAAICVSVVVTGPSLSWFLAPLPLTSQLARERFRDGGGR